MSRGLFEAPSREFRRFTFGERTSDHLVFECLSALANRLPNQMVENFGTFKKYIAARVLPNRYKFGNIIWNLSQRQ